MEADSLLKDALRFVAVCRDVVSLPRESRIGGNSPPDNCALCCYRFDRLGFSMLRTCSGVLAVIGMVICLSIAAQAADTTLTLACRR
jgi:hypothetical protein